MATISSAGSSEPVNQPEPSTKRDWRGALLRAVLPCYALGLISLRLLIDYPSLLGTVMAWLALIAFGLGAVYWRSTKGAAFWRLLGRADADSRGWTLYLAMTYTLLAAGTLIGYRTVGRTILVMPAIWLCLGWAVAAYCALTWHRPAIASNRMNVGALVLLGSFLAVGLALWPGFGKFLDVVLPRVSGRPAAPWQAQLAYAQSEATKINKDAVLETVTINAPYSLEAVSPTVELSLNFGFITPEGRGINVMFRDIDPPSTSNVSSDRGYLEKPTEMQVARWRSIEQALRIGPRDAWQATATDAAATLGERPSSLAISIRLFLLSGDVSNEPVGWQVTYDDYLQRDPAKPSMALYVVNATTGQIVDPKLEYPQPSRRKPRPQPHIDPAAGVN